MEIIILYVTLEGKFTIILDHHFTLLNHFRHGLFISFPFFLLSSLEVFVYAHLKNRRVSVLHEGLILHIMEHGRACIPAKSLKGKEKALSDWSHFFSSNTSSYGEEEWIEEDEDGSSSPISTLLRRGRRETLKENGLPRWLLFRNRSPI